MRAQQQSVRTILETERTRLLRGGGELGDRLLKHNEPLVVQAPQRVVRLLRVDGVSRQLLKARDGVAKALFQLGVTLRVNEHVLPRLFLRAAESMLIGMCLQLYTRY